MKILVLNGPNINLLGIREPDIYGQLTYPQLCDEIERFAQGKGIEVSILQSNHEGQLIDWIQQAKDQYDAIIINAGGYTHTSIAIMDALKAIQLPCVEVHLSNPKEREPYRHISYIGQVAIKTFSGEREKSYFSAIEYLRNN